MGEVEEEEDRLDQIMSQQMGGSQLAAKIERDLSYLKSDLTRICEENQMENVITEAILAALFWERQMIRLDMAKLEQNPLPGVQGPQNGVQVHPQPGTRDKSFTCTDGQHQFRFTLTHDGSGADAKVVCPRCNKKLKSTDTLRSHIRKGTRNCQCQCPRN